MTGSGTSVLVVDDEPAILRFLKPALAAGGYDVATASSITEAVKAIAARPPDIVVLDLGLPDGDGKHVIRTVREWSEVPIIVLSAREREAEKIEAFDLGADDYVNKPFGVGELMARMRAALRHKSQQLPQAPVLRIGELEIDHVQHRVMLRGQETKLTRKEFDLLSFLARNAGKVITHKQILHAVWGPAHTEDTQYLRVYIRQLRQKIEANPNDPKVIHTETGIGYRIAETG
jgi:two-component system, OmpR family, KDP operon response regulator KdpE